jgi:hypothetical protein
MTEYVVEVRNPVNGNWECSQCCKPAYRMHLERRWRWFLPHVVGVIDNLHEAEEEALERAVRQAKRLRGTFRREHTRITKNSTNGIEASSAVIWQNGRFK